MDRRYDLGIVLVDFKSFWGQLFEVALVFTKKLAILTQSMKKYLPLNFSFLLYKKAFAHRWDVVFCFFVKVAEKSFTN